MKILIPIRSLALAWACVLSMPAQAELAPLKTVAAVDVPRYMGTWH
jgi:lipocalin